MEASHQRQTSWAVLPMSEATPWGGLAFQSALGTPPLRPPLRRGISK